MTYMHHNAPGLPYSMVHTSCIRACCIRDFVLSKSKTDSYKNRPDRDYVLAVHNEGLLTRAGLMPRS